ncbi:MAG: hypothetical protein CUN56_00530 [Phototrophicales bacterium]|nr:MAG: hypothetical protein CUN56_00530 [Phototrophicales bacterium]
MADKLSLFNGALVEYLGERPLVSLNDNRAALRVLNAVYDDGFVRSILKEHPWDFALRDTKIDYNPSYSSSFTDGEYIFTVPSDLVRINAVSTSYSFYDSIDYTITGDKLIAAAEELYIRYISDADSYGGDLSLWPQYAIDYAKVLLASKACVAINGDFALAKDLGNRARRALPKAESLDAANRPMRKKRYSSWVRSRGGDYS